MTVYRSKIDWWLIALIFVPVIWSVVECVTTSDYTNMSVMLIIFAAILVLLLQIKYVVNKNVLEVKSGFLGTQRININDIRSISKTYNPLSAPALSINRLEIKYGTNYGYVLISPKRRETFIAELQLANPAIAVKI